VSAGKFNQLVEIQQKSTTRNAFGEPIDTWVTFARCWAMYRPVRSEDRFNGAILQPVFDVVFRIRRVPGLTSEMRVVWRNRPFEIIGEPVLAHALDGTIEVAARAGVRDGR
jgi:SPP1 family predicted phage head-tail adaptor